jgi:hypothetical protein
MKSLLGIQVTTLSNYSIDKRRKNLKKSRAALKNKKMFQNPDISLEKLNFML